MDRMITHSVPYEEEDNTYADLNVEFNIPFIVDNDSFDHEFGTEQKPDYVTLDGEITWSRSRYTERQNEAIKEWLDDVGRSELEEEVSKQYWDEVNGQKQDAAIDRFLDRLDNL